MRNHDDLPVTARLRLRELGEDDAPFINRLLNDGDFLRYIGDRGVRNTADAIEYLQKGPIKSYRQNGHGLYLVEQRADGLPIGICGLVRRDGLDAPDLGFALMPEYRGLGYAYEAAKAVLDHAFAVLCLDRVLAIVAAENRSSSRLLEKLGMTAHGVMRLPNDSKELRLYELWRAE